MRRELPYGHGAIDAGSRPEPRRDGTAPPPASSRRSEAPIDRAWRRPRCQGGQADAGQLPQLQAFAPARSPQRPAHRRKPIRSLRRRRRRQRRRGGLDDCRHADWSRPCVPNHHVPRMRWRSKPALPLVVAGQTATSTSPVRPRARPWWTRSRTARPILGGRDLMPAAPGSADVAPAAGPADQRARPTCNDPRRPRAAASCRSGWRRASRSTVSGCAPRSPATTASTSSPRISLRASATGPATTAATRSDWSAASTACPTPSLDTPRPKVTALKAQLARGDRPGRHRWTRWPTACSSAGRSSRVPGRRRTTRHRRGLEKNACSRRSSSASPDQSVRHALLDAGDHRAQRPPQLTHVSRAQLLAAGGMRLLRRATLEPVAAASYAGAGDGRRRGLRIRGRRVAAGTAASAPWCSLLREPKLVAPRPSQQPEHRG